jgi:xylulokinase
MEPGDASGMNLMDLATGTWWREALDATAPDLDEKLPPIVPASTVVGKLSAYWQQRYGFPPAAVVAWTGDNPSSLVGTGLTTEGRVAVSLGTSDTVFGLMREPRVDPTGTGHVFGAPTGEFMGLTCFQNGSLARERVRAAHDLDWSSFSRALDQTPPGGFLFPWFVPEITPTVTMPGIRRYGRAAWSSDSEVRAIVDTQALGMARHSSWMGVTVESIRATGGGAVNLAILQTLADVFGTDVYQLEVTNSAALGAALRAAHRDLNPGGFERTRPTGGAPHSWDDVVRGFAEPVARLRPDPKRSALYQQLGPVFAACEAHALGQGPDPGPLLNRLPGRAGGC